VTADKVCGERDYARPGYLLQLSCRARPTRPVLRL
jgi:hypothetical protein